MRFFSVLTTMVIDGYRFGGGHWGNVIAMRVNLRFVRAPFFVCPAPSLYNSSSTAKPIFLWTYRIFVISRTIRTELNYIVHINPFPLKPSPLPPYSFVLCCHWPWWPCVLAAHMPSSWSESRYTEPRLTLILPRSMPIGPIRNKSQR